MKKLSLRSIGIIGFLIFAIFFYFTFGVPGYVETLGKNFIEKKVQERIDLKIDSISSTAFDFKNKEGALAKIAGKLLESNEQKIEKVKLQLKNKAYEQMASAIAEVRDLDCECREKYSKMIKDGFEFENASLQFANEKLQDFTKTKYMQVSEDLKRDVRIFTGSNMLVFLLLVLVSFLKPQAIGHLFLPATLLAVATVICSYLYIFNQDWLLTIIYSNYWGFAYLAYVGVVFLFLCDIVFNKGRITTEILNGILNALGSAASFVPC